MPASLEQGLWLFLIYAFLGWCTEVSFAAVKTGHFVNRGMANGPVCPIYGFGVLIVLIGLEPVKDNLILLFIGATILTSALEFVTGWALEKLFHAKWWDYSAQPCNIKGYICLSFSLIWGAACVVIVRFIHPLILTFVHFLDNLPGRIALCALLLLFLVDEIVTFIQTTELSRRLQRIEKTQRRLRELSDGIGAPLADHVLNAAHKLEESHEEHAEKLEAIREEYGEKREAIRSEYGEKLEALREERTDRIAALVEERRRLAQQLEGLLEQHNRFHEHLLHAFPALGHGRHEEAVARIEEHFQQRKLARKAEKLARKAEKASRKAK